MGASFSAIGLCLSLFLFTSLFDKARYKILQLLKARNEDLGNQKKETEKVNDQLQEKIGEIASKNKQLEHHWNSLLEVSKKICIHSESLESALQYIALVTANSLKVSRVSIWLYHVLENFEENIECLVAYSFKEDKYIKLETIKRNENIKYFDAIKREKIIAANDAFSDPDTSGFAEHYLTDHKISSMMDAPFFLENGLAGVICCEHQNNQREWSPEDIIFSTSMAEVVALAFRSASRNAYEKKLEALTRRIQQQNTLLVRQKEEVQKANESLEIRVQQRTLELTNKNQQLSEYAFINSHLLRGPLCRILGLINLFNYRDPRFENELLKRLRESGEELDLIVKKISQAVTPENGVHS